jgi:hypothetical protein
MVTNAERKEHPISMRLPEVDIAMIDCATGRARILCAKLLSVQPRSC